MPVWSRFVVVPIEERFAVAGCVVDGVEAGGPVGPVLQRFEDGFCVGVVVGYTGSGERSADAERVVKVGEGARRHLCTPVGMDSQLMAVHVSAVTDIPG